MKTENVKDLTVAAMFAALCCVATMAFKVPTPTNGYVHLGDCFVLLAGFLLSPAYGAAAAGVGSALADLLSGYAYYVPASLIVKALCALIAYALYSRLGHSPMGAIAAAAAAECAMVAGYFCCEGIVLGYGAAALAGVPMNIGQGVFGLVSSVVLLKALERAVPVLRR